jgi:hypothetical protein
MEHQVYRQQEHRPIRQAIDQAYLETITSAAILRLYAMRPSGPYKPLFLDFYGAFFLLFNLTCHRPHLAEKEKHHGLIEEIDTWFDMVKKADDHTHGEEGIRLFKKWREALDDAGMISV